MENFLEFCGLFKIHQLYISQTFFSKICQQIQVLECTQRLITKICDKLNYLNRHRSKSIWVFKLSFWQNDPPMSTSFQKKRLVTHILFDLCLFKHFSLSQIFVISLQYLHFKILMLIPLISKMYLNSDTSSIFQYQYF